MSSERSIAISQHLEPGVHRAILALLGGLGLLTCFFFVWASVGKLDIAVHGKGELISSSRLQQIQSLEGGILSQLLAREGQRVRAGEVLVRIDNQQLDSALGESQQTYWGLLATVVRLEAEINGHAPRFSDEIKRQAPQQVEWEQRAWAARASELRTTVEAMQHQSSQRVADVAGTSSRLVATQENLHLARQSLTMESNLFKAGAGAKTDLIGAQQRVAQLEGEMAVLRSTKPGNVAALSETRSRAAELVSRFKAEANTQRNELQTRIDTLRERIQGETDKVQRRELRAPMDGVVNRIVTSSIGGVIKSGETVLELVPLNDKVVINTKVRPEDIGFITLGQTAQVRLSAYDSSVYGPLSAQVTRVGQDALQNERKEFYFEVRIEADHWPSDMSGKPLTILPGMTADVAIRTGERTVLQYMLKPIAKVLDTSLKER